MAKPTASAAAPTITDSFNRGNSSSLGADWTEIEGDLTIDSNQLTVSTAPGAGRHNTTLASADHYVQASVVSGNSAGVLVRAHASDVTYYMGRHNGTAYEVFKRVTGTFTSLATLTEAAPSTPWTIRLEVQGSALRLYANGTLKVSTTNGDITGNVRVGVRGAALGNRYDDFAASEL